VNVRDKMAAAMSFVGGNAFMVRMLNRYRTELGVAALPSELESTARATVRQLQQETATVAVSTPSLNESTLRFVVDVHNLTGHKFPDRLPVASHVVACHRAQRQRARRCSSQDPSTAPE